MELLCSERSGATETLHLPLGDHMHRLDATQENARAAKGFKPEHRSGDIAARTPLHTHTTAYPLEQANEALANPREGRLTGAAVLKIRPHWAG